MAEIIMTQQEALGLLSKWKDESRVIHLSVTSGAVIVKIAGRIDELTTDTVYFSAAKSSYSLGKYNLARIPVSASRFEYSDAKDAPEVLRSKLEGYDALLYIYYADDDPFRLRVGIGLAVLPMEEWADF